MGENFEKIVLEKLNNMAKKLDSFEKGTSERLDNFNGRLDGFNERLDDFNGRLDDFNGRLDGFNGRLGTFNGRLDNFTERLDKVENNQNDLRQIANNIMLELKDTQDIVMLNRNSLLQMENTFNDKISALFDFRSINDEKHNEFSKSIKKLQKDSFNHDIKISVLEKNLNKLREA